VLSRQILYEVIHEEVLRRHLVVGPADLKAASADQDTQIGKDPQGHDLWAEFSPTYKDLLARRGAEFTALQNALPGASVDDAAIQKYYDSNPTQWAQVCLSDVVVKDQAQANDLHRQLVGGADFAALARQFSIDTRSAVKGGDQGCASTSTFSAPFDQVVPAVPVGQVSAVVQTANGFYIIKVTSHTTQPLSAVRTQIVQALQTNGQQQLSQFVQAQLTKAAVSLNPRYGTYDKTSGNIARPAAPTADQGGITPTTVNPALSGAGAQVPTSTP
jgi:foldase protein PrsA